MTVVIMIAIWIIICVPVMDGRWTIWAKPDWSVRRLSASLCRRRSSSGKCRRRRKGRVRSVSCLSPRQEGVDVRVYPEKMIVNCLDYKDRKRAEIELTVFNKPAVRLPEAYWLSFNADDIVSLVAEKTGATVNLLDVVEKGNRQQHGIDRYVDLITSGGTIRIWSEAAFLVNVGEARGLNYSTRYPDKRGGVHFNLSNNLWGTNFSMWNEGSLTYRFTVEML